MTAASCGPPHPPSAVPARASPRPSHQRGPPSLASRVRASRCRLRALATNAPGCTAALGRSQRGACTLSRHWSSARDLPLHRHLPGERRHDNIQGTAIIRETFHSFRLVERQLVTEPNRICSVSSPLPIYTATVTCIYLQLRVMIWFSAFAGWRKVRRNWHYIVYRRLQFPVPEATLSNAITNTYYIQVAHQRQARSSRSVQSLCKIC